MTHNNIQTRYIVHHPRCSKSRQALALLDDSDVQYEIIDYLKKPLTASQLHDLFKYLSLTNPMNAVRTKEKEFALSGLNKTQNGLNDIVNAIAQYPKLLERPILIVGDKAIIGRPPEDILRLIL